MVEVMTEEEEEEEGSEEREREREIITIMEGKLLYNDVTLFFTIFNSINTYIYLLHTS